MAFCQIIIRTIMQSIMLTEAFWTTPLLMLLLMYVCRVHSILIYRTGHTFHGREDFPLAIIGHTIGMRRALRLHR
jgi:hypothetical protein